MPAYFVFKIHVEAPIIACKTRPNSNVIWIGRLGGAGMETTKTFVRVGTRDIEILEFLIMLCILPIQTTAAAISNRKSLYIYKIQKV